MLFLLTLPFAIQGAVMFVDEFYYHHKRGLGRWERWGHPLDTSTVLACFAVLVFAQPTPFFLGLFAVLALFSCVFVTKDEFVHARECVAGEQWLHGLLFILHPLLMLVGALFWVMSSPENELGTALLRIFGESAAPSWLRSALVGQLAMAAAFGVYQIVYWNLFAPESKLLRTQNSMGQLPDDTPATSK